MRYALIQNGTVITVVEQDTLPDLPDFLAVEANERTAPGDLYIDGQLVEQDAPVVPRVITKLAFRNRFTLNEKAAIEFAAIDNPSGTLEQRLQSAALRAMLKDVDVASFIDLDRPDTRSGVEQLETIGILSAGRASAILNGEIADSERPIV